MSTRQIALLIIVVIVILGVVFLGRNIYFVESAFEKAPVGRVEIKTIPESRVLMTEMKGNYFNTKNSLFRVLFNYIQNNQVAMTVPVEAEIDSSKMKFYLGTKDKVKDLPDQRNVRVVTVPGRTVASIGIRGSYTKGNFDKALEKLEGWLKENTQYVPAGEAYGIFWDGPFMPSFLKRSEVHIPVTKQGA